MSRKLKLILFLCLTSFTLFAGKKTTINYAGSDTIKKQDLNKIFAADTISINVSDSVFSIDEEYHLSIFKKNNSYSFQNKTVTRVKNKVDSTTSSGSISFEDLNNIKNICINGLDLRKEWGCTKLEFFHVMGNGKKITFLDARCNYKFDSLRALKKILNQK